MWLKIFIIYYTIIYWKTFKTFYLVNHFLCVSLIVSLTCHFLILYEVALKSSQPELLHKICPNSQTSEFRSLSNQEPFNSHIFAIIYNEMIPDIFIFSFNFWRKLMWKSVKSKNSVIFRKLNRFSFYSALKLINIKTFCLKLDIKLITHIYFKLTWK